MHRVASRVRARAGAGTDVAVLEAQQRGLRVESERVFVLGRKRQLLS